MTQTNRTTATVLVGAAIVGVIAGAGPMAATPDGRNAVVTKARDLAVAAGVTRRRPPQSGDVWGGCNDARAAGTAPIYRGEPGHREDMDGDGDGIACEPPRS